MRLLDELEGAVYDYNCLKRNINVRLKNEGEGDAAVEGGEVLVAG